MTTNELDSDLQKAVAYLTSNPKKITEFWLDPDASPHGALFRYLTPTGECVYSGHSYGCLVMVKCGRAKAFWPEITQAVRADNGIPDKGEDITVNHLMLFAEWMQKLRK